MSLARALVVALLLTPFLDGCASPPSPPEPARPRACDAPALALARGGAPAPEQVAFEAPDGVSLVGARWPGSDDHAVVLVHGRNETRGSWGWFASELALRGFSVLAFDLRGHGESTTRGNQSYEARNFTKADFQAVERDVLGMVGVARARSSVPCLAVVGSGLGANAALRASTTPGANISLVALLSPTLDDKGVTTLDVIRSYGERPIFLAAAWDDVVGAQSAQRLASETRNATLRLVGGGGQGTAVLTVEDLAKTLEAWLTARV